MKLFLRLHSPELLLSAMAARGKGRAPNTKLAILPFFNYYYYDCGCSSSFLSSMVLSFVVLG